MKIPYRLLVLASHPIQYQAPLYRKLSDRPEIEPMVLFCSRKGLENYWDEGFKKTIKWDIPLLRGYEFKFLYNWSPDFIKSGFWNAINLDVVNHIRYGSYDALFINGWGNLTNWLAMLTAFACGVPILLRGETNLLPKSPLWKRTVKKIILKRLFKHISAFLAIGQYNIEFYKSYGVSEEKIFHVPYAVNNDFFLSQARQLLSRKILTKQKLNIPNGLPVILFSGKFIPAKRPLDLLKSFELISKTEKALLVYVGDGPLKNELIEYARIRNLSSVYFAGFRNQTELPEFYSIADIFVLPSGFEPWGLVVNEAMCFGLPVIVSDQVGAGGDLVKEGVNGFVYEAANITKLAESLSFLIRHDGERIAMGKNSMRIIQGWSFNEDVDAILQCLKKL